MTISTQTTNDSDSGEAGGARDEGANASANLSNDESARRSESASAAADTGPRVYAACLAAYNNGILHGRWIDAAQEPADIWREISEMLSASPIPNAEEHAFHDFEGFGKADIPEYAGVDTVARLAAFIVERGEDLGGGVLTHFGGEIGDAEAAFEDYAGEWKSLADFAQDLTEETGTEIPKPLEYYIDWQAMGRDMEMSGDIFTVETGFEEIHVFWAR